MSSSVKLLPAMCFSVKLGECVPVSSHKKSLLRYIFEGEKERSDPCPHKIPYLVTIPRFETSKALIL